MATSQTECFTEDGVRIVPGLGVWNLDLRRDRVLGVHHVEDELIHGRATGRCVTWWTTEHGLFDGSRMVVRHPRTGEPAG